MPGTAAIVRKHCPDLLCGSTMTTYRITFPAHPRQALRDRLRALPSIVGTPPAVLRPVDRDRGAGRTMIDWLETAIDFEVPEPLHSPPSTADGLPDPRALIVKNISGDAACEFAIRE
jgi:hypothetical protein